MIRTTGLVLALLVGATGRGLCQDKPAATDTDDLLKKSLAAYSDAKSYDGQWTYSMDRGGITQSATMTIRCKGPTKLYLRLVAAKAKTASAAQLDPIPELLVIVDGKTATFENVASKEYFSVPLPKNGLVTPVMFFPQVQTVANADRDPDGTLDGKPVMVFKAKRSDGSTTRLEIDPVNFHIRRIVSEAPYGAVKLISTLTADKESFGGEIADSVFAWRAPRGSKQIPAPPGTAELFGVPDAPAAPGAPAAGAKQP